MSKEKRKTKADEYRTRNVDELNGMIQQKKQDLGEIDQQEECQDDEK